MSKEQNEKEQSQPISPERRSLKKQLDKIRNKPPSTNHLPDPSTSFERHRLPPGVQAKMDRIQFLQQLIDKHNWTESQILRFLRDHGLGSKYVAQSYIDSLQFKK